MISLDTLKINSISDSIKIKYPLRTIDAQGTIITIFNKKQEEALRLDRINLNTYKKATEVLIQSNTELRMLDSINNVIIKDYVISLNVCIDQKDVLKESNTLLTKSNKDLIRDYNSALDKNTELKNDNTILKSDLKLAKFKNKVYFGVASATIAGIAAILILK